MSRIHDAPPSGHLEPLQFDKFVYDPQALKFDEVNTGLQRDHGPEAPEAIIVRDGIDAPETVVESGLEMPLSEPPILAEVPKFLKSERDSSDTIGARPQSRRRARSAAVILILLTLAGLAIGLGLGLTRSSPTSGAAQTNLGGNSSNSSNISPSAPALISENSALAAGTLENGDRVLFFQDSEQRLRKAAYSGDSWKLLEDISSTMLATISPSSSLSLDIVHTSSDLVRLRAI
ncbi:hypothetical protein MMC10_001734 [Thelotrema lepadinum]|nr:hypothetical protein [Thelotrema lepadinum]